MARSPEQLRLLQQFMQTQMSTQPTSALEEELARQAKELEERSAERPPEWGEPRPVQPQYGSVSKVSAMRPETTAARPKTREGAFIEGMIKRGWSREEAAGLAGNIQLESAFRPEVRSSAPGEQSFGLMQWNKDRLQGLKNMAAKTGRDWRDPEAQMDWIQMERSGESVKFGGSNERGFYAKALEQKGTPEEYAERIGRFVERPRKLSDTLQARQQFARQAYAPTEAVTAAPSPAFDTEAQVTPTTQGAPKVSKTTTPTSKGVTSPTFEGANRPVYSGKGFVFHHSGGGSLKSLEDTLKKRKLGSQYLMDRDGTIYSFGGKGSSHIQPNDKWGGIAPGLQNANAVGMEIVAKDDNDLTPAQVEAAKKFIEMFYPDMPVYGHGEVNPGHKQEREGMTVVDAIRAARNQRQIGMTAG